jgi:hypothetical protein
VNRVVRTTPEFWEALDRALPTGSDPSWHEFASWELPIIVQRVAAEWDVMARFPGDGGFGAWLIAAHVALDGPSKSTSCCHGHPTMLTMSSG